MGKKRVCEGRADQTGASLSHTLGLHASSKASSRLFLTSSKAALTMCGLPIPSSLRTTERSHQSVLPVARTDQVPRSPDGACNLLEVTYGAVEK
jgi:hypothetical protein